MELKFEISPSLLIKITRKEYKEVSPRCFWNDPQLYIVHCYIHIYTHRYLLKQVRNGQLYCCCGPSIICLWTDAFPCILTSNRRYPTVLKRARKTNHWLCTPVPNDEEIAEAILDELQIYRSSDEVRHNSLQLRTILPQRWAIQKADLNNVEKLVKITKQTAGNNSNASLCP